MYSVFWLLNMVLPGKWDFSLTYLFHFLSVNSVFVTYMFSVISKKSLSGEGTKNIFLVFYSNIFIISILTLKYLAHSSCISSISLCENQSYGRRKESVREKPERERRRKEKERERLSFFYCSTL